MTQQNLDPKQVYGRDTGNYDEIRPDFPKEMIDNFMSENALDAKDKPIIVDIGAGTGRLGKRFIEKGCEVYFIEPNDNMRDTLSTDLLNQQNAHIIKGTASRTNIPDDIQADAIVMGDSAHWIGSDPQEKTQVLKEFKRVLKPDGKVGAFSAVWAQSSPIVEQLQSILQEAYPDYKESGNSIIYGAEAQLQRRGAHLIDAEKNKWHGLTDPMPLTQEKFTQFMKSLSWNQRITEDPEAFKSKVVEPLWKWGKNNGQINEKEEMNIPQEFRCSYGNRRLLQTEKIERQEAKANSAALATGGL